MTFAALHGVFNRDTQQVLPCMLGTCVLQVTIPVKYPVHPRWVLWILTSTYSLLIPIKEPTTMFGRYAVSGARHPRLLPWLLFTLFQTLIYFKWNGNLHIVSRVQFWRRSDSDGRRPGLKVIATLWLEGRSSKVESSPPDHRILTPTAHEPNP
jgi:hypothetical protein